MLLMSKVKGKVVAKDRVNTTQGTSGIQALLSSENLPANLRANTFTLKDRN